MIPLLILTMVLGYSGNPQLASIGNTILLGTILLVVVLDMVLLRRRLRRSSLAGSRTRASRARPTTPSCARCR